MTASGVAANRVANGWMWLDEKLVVSPPDLVQTRTLDVAIDVAPGSHTLRVRVVGQPTALITATVTGTIHLADLHTARAGHTTTLLNDGRALVFGGSRTAGDVAEVFDPAALTFQPVPVSGPGRRGHVTVALPTSDMWIAGGVMDGAPTSSSVVVNAVSGLAALATPLGSPRSGHSATMLPDGRLLIVGGSDPTGVSLATGEIHDPRPDAFSDGRYDPLGSKVAPVAPLLVTPRAAHSATLLPSGFILVAGGLSATGELTSLELLNPASGLSILLPIALRTPRSAHAAVLLPDGRVLVAGGRSGAAFLDSIEIVSANLTRVEQASAHLRIARASHTLTLMSWGDVLVAGGEDASGFLAHTELIEAFAPDVTAPAVTNVFPASGAHDVERGALVSVRFSEPVDLRALASGGIALRAGAATVVAAVSTSHDGLYAFLQPDALLAAGVVHTVEVSSVRDGAGNILAPFSSSYTVVDAPVITALQPDHGPGGTAVTIVGSHFGEQPDDNRATAGGTSLSLDSASATALTFIVPPIGLGPQQVTVRTRGGVAKAPTPFIVENPVPVLASVDPPQTGAGSGPVLLTLAGDRFAAGATVLIGVTALAPDSLTRTRATVMVPASLLATPATLPVALVNPPPGGGPSNALALEVIQTGPPVIALTIFPHGISLGVGGGQTFAATAQYADGTKKDVSTQAHWVTADSAVASVNVAGRVTAGSPGSTTLRVTLGGFSASADIRVSEGEPIPTDPALVAPALPTSAATPFGRGTAFLFEGENPIQRGVAPGAIEDRRVAVLRGRVTDRSGSPIVGARVTLADHPELGYTLTREDGAFDLAANGGGLLTAHLDRTGYLPVERQIVPRWHDYATVDAIVMTPLDANLTRVDLSATVPQIARGSVITDDSGTRRATVLFPSGTVATVRLADGTTQSLANVSVRATEYTVGTDGKAMPAPLPPTSGYTYAVEYSIDETQGLPGASVEFSQPVSAYTDNFLHFPAGTPIPAGDYDPVKHVWVPADDGRVLAVVAATGGVADLDVNGTGGASSAAALAALGITDAERAKIAELYNPGQSFWRVPVRHFSTKDFNMSFKGPDDAQSPNQTDFDGGTDGELDECDCDQGSIIEAQNQGLGESVPLVGVDFTLEYRTSRVPRRRSAYTVSGSLSGSTVPASLKRIDLVVSVAGRDFPQTFPAQPNQRYSFTWDGNDGYGRRVEGAAQAAISLSYVYDGSYSRSTGSTRSFGLPGGTVAIGDVTRQEFILTQTRTTTLGTLSMGSATGNGWSLSIVHAYDPQSSILYYGDGRRQSMRSVPLAITTVAGTPITSGVLAPTPATQLTLTQPKGFVATSDGGFYVTNGTSTGGVGQTYKIDPAGQVQSIATPSVGRIQAVTADETQYFVDTAAHVVRQRTPAGVLTVVAGTLSQGGFAGDGGPATSAKLSGPTDVALGRDGVVYISDSGNRRIRRVGTDGTITTYAGGGTIVFSTVDGPALQHQFFDLRGIAVGLDGSVYAADFSGRHIYRVRPSGIISNFAGGGSFQSGDGSPARQSPISSPTDVQVAADGTVYMATAGGIRRVDNAGIIGTVSTATQQPAENTPARNTLGGTAQEVAAAPDGSVFASVIGGSPRVARFGSSRHDATAGQIVVPSDDGADAYVFDDSGRHLETRDATTNVQLFAFEYDLDGRVIGITDQDGQHTTIERAGVRMTALVAPGNARTAFQTDTDGRIVGVDESGGRSWSMGYTDDGLLASFKDPIGGEEHFSYDTDGRLVLDENAAVGRTRLAASRGANVSTVTVTSPEGRASTYAVTKSLNGDLVRIATDPSGLQTKTVDSTDGKRTITAPDGTQLIIEEGQDPRWSTQVKFAQTVRVRTPSNSELFLSGTQDVQMTQPGNPFAFSSTFESLEGAAFIQSTRFTASTRTLVRTFGNRSVTSTLDAAGRPVRVQHGSLTPSQLTYDARGRLTTIVRGTRAANITYDDRNRPVTVTDPLNQVTTYEYDDADRVIRQTLPGNRDLRLAYDNYGNITSLTPPGRPPYRFTFDALNQATAVTPPAVPGAGATAYQYDRDRKLLSIAAPSGASTTFDYDAGGRLKDVTFSRGKVHYAYDGAGRVATITTPDGPDLQFAYDGFLSTSERWSGVVQGVVDRTFDRSSLRVSRERVNGAAEIFYSVDLDGQTTFAGPQFSGAGGLFIDRDPNTRQVSQAVLGGVERRSYNAFGELGELIEPHYFAQYTRDPLGRITSIVDRIDETDRVTEYRYDAAGRLQVVRLNGDLRAAYTYDANGNRVLADGPAGPVVGTYDDQDRLLTYGPASYTYTPEGRLASRTRFGATTTYEYDTLGNLVTVVLPDGRTIRYTIDGRGRRVAKAVDGVRVTAWLYGDELRPIAELDGTGALVSRFVYATRVNLPDFFIRNGVSYRVFVDQVGSPRVVVDTATGEVVQRMDFGPFGELTQDSNPGFQPFGFAGGLHDPDTGLVHFGARDYDAEVGRWTTRDPIGFGGGDPNLYGYGLSDPINTIDPYGLQFAPALGAVGAAVGGAVTAAGSVVVDAATGGVNILATPAEVAAGVGLGAVVGGAIGAVLDALIDNGAMLAENTKAVQNKIDSLLKRARVHATKCETHPPDDPNQNKWRNEAKAMLDRAARLANRLPNKLQQRALSMIASIQGLL